MPKVVAGIQILTTPFYLVSGPAGYVWASPAQDRATMELYAGVAQAAAEYEAKGSAEYRPAQIRAMVDHVVEENHARLLFYSLPPPKTKAGEVY